LHPYAHDSSRPAVPAYHYCTHNTSADLHQCIVFDSNEPSARLIGVEYIITEKLFRTLDDEEKKLWHSHKYEVESGKYAYVQLGIHSYSLSRSPYYDSQVRCSIWSGQCSGDACSQGPSHNIW